MQNDDTTTPTGRTFASEISDFRKLFTSRTFWEKGEEFVDRTFQAFFFSYLYSKDGNEYAVAFESTVDEFERRRMYNAFRPATT